MGRFAEYLAEVDFHGPSRVLRSRGGCLRIIFWVIVLVITFAMMIYAIVGVAQYYASYPVTSSTSVRRRKGAILPAITICNKRFMATPGSPARLADQTERDYLSKNGYQLQDLVTNCAWDGENIPGINCSQTLEVIQTQVFPYGNCYTFNAVRDSMIERGEAEGEGTAEGEGAEAEGENKDEDSEFYVKTTGYRGALSLTLASANNIPKPEQVYVDSLPGLLYDDTQGLVMQLHQPGSPADFRKGKSFQVEIASSTERVDIAISKTRVYRSLAPPYSRNCKDKGRLGPSMFRRPKQLTGNFMDAEEKEGEGNPDECIKECLRKKVREKNNCTLYDMQDEQGPNYKCQELGGKVTHNLQDAIMNVDTEASVTVDDELGECQEECPEPCELVDYDYEVKKYATTRDKVVNIYYTDFLMEKTVQTPVFTAALLLREIGIILLIWIGFSFMTFMHTLEFLLDLIFGCCTKKREVADDEEGAQ